MTAKVAFEGRPFRGPAHFLPRWTAAQAGAAAIAAASALLALAPIVSLAVIAFGGDAEIWAHLAAYVLPAALLQTSVLLLGVALLTAVIGVGTAWAVTAFEFPGRGALIWLLPLPLAIPTYIAAYIYVDIFDAFSTLQVRSLGGAVFVFGIVLYPYVYLASRAMFQTQPAVFTDAARVVGARPWQLARSIALPLARPAIAVGLALALLETLNDIGASEYLGVQTLTRSIFTTWLNRGSLAGAAQIACVMLIFVIALVALERSGRRAKSYTGSAQAPRAAARIALTGFRQWLACALCLLPVLLGFLLPAAYLAREVAVRGLVVGFDVDLLRHTAVTIAFAAMATAIALVIGFAAVAGLRWTRQPFVAACVNIAGIGYAIPGTVLALGLLSPLVLMDEGINALTRAIAGVGVGLVIAGSGAAVVIAYVTRFLAIPLGFAQAGFARIAPEFDEAARLLGARPGTIMRSLHLPLARPAIWGAALLVFVDCLKELPATLLLRPLNVETLSTYIYQYAARGNFEEGALAALLIVAVGILPVIRIVRFADLTPAP
jgi:iron(III) transport system permease protein